MKKIILLTLLPLILFAVQAGAQNQQDIDKALSSGNTVYLLLKDKNTNIAKTEPMLKAAVAEVKKANYFIIDKSAPGNKAIVGKYKLNPLPVPSVMVLASNGITTAVLANDKINQGNMVKAVPTPGQANVLKLLGEGKSVFMVVSDIAYPDRAATLATCKTSCDQMKGKAVSIEVKAKEKSEEKFLKFLEISLSKPQSSVVVFNSKGQMTGIFPGTTKAAELIKAASKADVPCCPPGTPACKK
ncbi:MAG: hypothetical protein WCO63_06895 [Bacteroidota bacterium]